jgi:hypothetical protein
VSEQSVTTPPPPPDPPTAWRQKIVSLLHSHIILADTPVCAWFFAGSLACVLAACALGGDMILAPLLLLLGWIFVTVGWTYAPNLSRAAKAVWITASAFVFIAIGYGLYRHFQKPSESQQQIAAKPLPSLPPEQTDLNVFVNCEPSLLPSTGPPQMIRTLEMNPVPEPYGPSYQEMSAPIVLSPVKQMEQIGDIYKCEVYNYEDKVIFGATIPLRAAFWESVPSVSPNSHQYGKLILDRNWQFSIEKIDVGKENPYIFYVFNPTQLFEQIRIPSIIYIKNNAGITLHAIRASDHNVINLSPKPAASKVLKK